MGGCDPRQCNHATTLWVLRAGTLSATVQNINSVSNRQAGAGERSHLARRSSNSLAASTAVPGSLQSRAFEPSS